MHVPSPPPRPVLEEAVRRALLEDLRQGDPTTEACVPPDAHATARIVAREPLVLCGVALVEEVYRQLDARVEVEPLAHDGQRLASGHSAARLRGPARSLLMGERVALNFLQHLSGVASRTADFVARLPEGSGTRITGTRKTIPGIRALQRWALRCGGAHDHRPDLGAAPMIKDNHVAAKGSLRAAVEAVRARAAHGVRVECEVDRLEQIEEALKAGAEVLLLDNFTDEQVRRAVRQIAGRARIEVSGGITEERIATLAALGVDAISVGAPTHSARAMDLGLDWDG